VTAVAAQSARSASRRITDGLGDAVGRPNRVSAQTVGGSEG